MACRIQDFTLIGKWRETLIGPAGNAHCVLTAPAVTEGRELAGILYKVDGRFKGFVGSEDAAIWWAKRELNLL